MRTVFLAVMGAFLLLWGGLGCSHDPASPQPVLTGKVVVTYPCDHYVIQVINGSYDSARVTKSWTDTNTDSTYSNVFLVNYGCSLTSVGIPRGGLFNFIFVDTISQEPACYTCNIAVPIPGPIVQEAIQFIQKD